MPKYIVDIYTTVAVCESFEVEAETEEEAEDLAYDLSDYQGKCLSRDYETTEVSE